MGSGRPRPHVWWLGVLDQAQGWELAVGRGHLLYKMAVVQGRKVVLVWLASSERGREQCQPRAWVSPYPLSPYCATLPVTHPSLCLTLTPACGGVSLRMRKQRPRQVKSDSLRVTR